MVSGGLRPPPSQLAPALQEQRGTMGQNPAQEVRQTVSALATPPPTGVPPPPPYFSRSNSPLLRCPAHRGFPIGSRGSQTRGAGTGAPASGRGRQLRKRGDESSAPRRPHARIPSPRPHLPRSEPPPRLRRGRGATFPSRGSTARSSRTSAWPPDNPVTLYVSPPVCSAAPATRHPLPGAPPPPPQPIRGAAALEPANPGAREAPGPLHHPLAPAPRPRPQAQSPPGFRTRTQLPSARAVDPYPPEPGPLLGTERGGGGAAGAGFSKSL